jgi:hypothetical protein
MSVRRKEGGFRARNRTLCLLLFLAASASCGYRAVYASAGGGRLHVKLVRTLVPDAVASDEVAAGVRDELALAGLLEPGDGFPRAEIEVLRSDEACEGIEALSGEPVARATNIGLIARAWIARADGASAERDTGDLRAQEVIAVDERNGVTGTKDPRASAFHAADALRAAARRLGRKLAQRLMGAPSASEDVSGARPKVEGEAAANGEAKRDPGRGERPAGSGTIASAP